MKAVILIAVLIAIAFAGTTDARGTEDEHVVQTLELGVAEADSIAALSRPGFGSKPTKKRMPKKKKKVPPKPKPDMKGAIPLSEADKIPDATVPDPRPTILGLVASLPEQFGILGLAVGAVDGLGATLDDPASRLTVFAPTDEAFTALANAIFPSANLEATDKEGVLAALAQAIGSFSENPAAKFSTLESILLYHAVGKPFPFQKLERRGIVKTLGAGRLRFLDGKVIDMDPSRPDATASPQNIFLQNGWVHVIDSVLLPFNSARALGQGIDAIPIAEAKKIGDAKILRPPKSILEYLASRPNKCTILALAAGTVDGLLDKLGTDSERLTLFAPTDDAFIDLARLLVPDAKVSRKDKPGVLAVLGEAVAPLADLPEAGFATVESILAYHLLSGAFPFQKLARRRKVKTVNGAFLRFNKRGRVVDADKSRRNPHPNPRNVFAKNGWVHVIDTVLLPFDLNDL